MALGLRLTLHLSATYCASQSHLKPRFGGRGPPICLAGDRCCVIVLHPTNGAWKHYVPGSVKKSYKLLKQSHSFFPAGVGLGNPRTQKEPNGLNQCARFPAKSCQTAPHRPGRDRHGLAMGPHRDRQRERAARIRVRAAMGSCRGSLWDRAGARYGVSMAPLWAGEKSRGQGKGRQINQPGRAGQAGPTMDTRRAHDGHSMAPEVGSKGRICAGLRWGVPANRAK